MSTTRILVLVLTLVFGEALAAALASPAPVLPSATGDAAAMAPGSLIFPDMVFPDAHHYKLAPALPSAPMRGQGRDAFNCGTTERVSVASDGAQAEGAGNPFWNAMMPAMSADGRFVAFAAEASNLVPDDTNGTLDVFVHDRQTGVTERVSVASDGSQANGWSNGPAMSADGRFVVFHSVASNLVPGDTNGTSDTFVHDRTSGITERVSVASDGSQANAPVWNNPAISADGRFVAFMSDASNLVPGTTNGETDIFVHDRVSGTTERVSVASDGSQANAASSNPGLSGDGRYVTFVSRASNLVPDDTNNHPDVFVHDRLTGVTERVSVASDGSQANDWSEGSGTSTISADGRYVAFVSVATNLVPGIFDGNAHVFVHDRDTGNTEWISRDARVPDDFQGLSGSYSPALSADGRFVLFLSSASNLVAGDTNGDWDVFLHDRAEGGTVRVSTASDCTQADDAPGYGVVFTAHQLSSAHVAISDDGRHAAFYAMYPNLVAGDTNQAADVFVNTRPVLAIHPEPLDFGPVRVGQSRELAVSITNTGADSVTISAISGVAAPFTAIGGSCGAPPFTLDPQAGCQLMYSFSPDAGGGLQDVLNVTSDAPDGPYYIALRGTGSDDQLHVGPVVLDFSGVILGRTSGPASVTLTNADGAVPVEINAIDDAPVPFLAAGGSCGQPPFILGPHVSCTLTYTFSPESRDLFSEMIAVASDADNDPAMFSLLGRGLALTLEVEPGLLNFGTVAVGETGGPLQVSVINSGDVDIRFFGALPPPAPFGLVENSCDGMLLTAGAECVLGYTFQPAAPDDSSATIEIFTDQPVMADFTLRGDGAGAILSTAPERIEAALAIGQTRELALTLGNLGNTALEWGVTENLEVGGGQAVTLSHSASMAVQPDNTLACQDMGTAANQYLRRFKLTDFGLYGELTVTGITFGVSNLFWVGADRESVPITVNLYTQEGEFIYEDLQYLGGGTVDLEAQELTLVMAPVRVTVPAGAILVVEIAAPDLAGDEETFGLFLPGGNDQGQSAPSYIASSACGLDWPLSMEEVGYPQMHLVMEVGGHTDTPFAGCALPEWVNVTPGAGTVPAGGQQEVEVVFDAAGLEPGEYQAFLCLDSNDIAVRPLPVTVVPLNLIVAGGALDTVFRDAFEDD